MASKIFTDFWKIDHIGLQIIKLGNLVPASLHQGWTKTKWPIEIELYGVYWLFWSIGHMVFSNSRWNEAGIDTWTWLKSNLSLTSTYRPYGPEKCSFFFTRNFPNGLHCAFFYHFWPILRLLIFDISIF